MQRQEPEATQLRAFGATLRLIRTDAGLTQEQLGHAAGVGRTYIGEAETGVRNPTLTTIWQLAAALHVSPRSFFPYVEPQDPADGTASLPRA
ncbi:helix-turn-helix domain-containing protein [Cellulomonas endometrii]|uniref:helix-turn-helix domain-containing protein n=1 Tax=Cellulomonas endometrii TaxID=3036301 RepID=UPI0024AD130E|nr:helix-turn-helix transcriptional regulator [Cellulomonas endometrii]